MGLKIYQVDAFTQEPFRGNPAAVCLLTEPRDASWMQNLAREMNLSETAFVEPIADQFNLRWFTPTIEVDLCGHATLASAHVLWESEYLTPDQPAKFLTKSGTLTATKNQNWIELNFPAQPATKQAPPDGLADALKTSWTFVGYNGTDYIVEVDGEQTVRELKPDMDKLAAIKARGVMVTSRANGEEFDFVSRFFGPAVGIPEDPVTGSAHCCLAPYWSAQLGKNELVGYQASERGGVVKTRLENDRIILGGQAVSIFHGELLAGGAK